MSHIDDAGGTRSLNLTQTVTYDAPGFEGLFLWKYVVENASTTLHPSETINGEGYVNVEYFEDVELPVNFGTSTDWYKGYSDGIAYWTHDTHPFTKTYIAPGSTESFWFTTSPNWLADSSLELFQEDIKEDASYLYEANVKVPGGALPAFVPKSLATLGPLCVQSQVNPTAPPPLPNPQSSTGNPIRYVDGVNLVVAPGLSSTGFGGGWGTTQSWSNDPSYSAGTNAGNGWVAGDQPRLYRTGSSLYLVTDAITAHFFDGQGTPDGDGNYATYAPRFFYNTTVTYDGANDQFVITADDGTVYRYLDFGSARPVVSRGAFQSRTDPGGLITQVTSRDTDGRPLEVQAAQTVGGVTTTESYLYAYLGSGDTNAGKLASVTLRRKVGAGAWATVQQVAYAYYVSGDANGNWGDLKRLTVSDAAGSVLDQRYYRYYTGDTFNGATQIGYRGGLKYELGPDAYARLKAAQGGTDAAVETTADATVATYADKYFEYDALHRASKETVSGAGCTSCSAGQGAYTYSYTTSSNTIGHNSWATKTVETRPDGSTNTVYTNAFGGVMLTAFADVTTGLVSITYYQYDSKGRVVLVANPSAVTGYSNAYPDLVRFVSGNAQYLSDSSGLVTNYTYGASTTATTLVPGDAVWYLKTIAIRQGETSTAVPKESLTYIMNTVGGLNFFHLASDTVYRNDNGTGGQTTNYAYTFLAGTNQPATVTATLPTVTTAQNGSNSATAATVVSDAFGRPVWIRDEAGFITYTAYDTSSGAVVKIITDVDTAQTGTFTNLPSGWVTPPGGGLHLVTSYEVDSLGRATKTTYPNGRIDYTVYNDTAHEVRYYAGWDATTNRPTGPTAVVRVDRANGYSETLTMSAPPTVSGGRPTGTESVSQVQSLSRSYTNEAGQLTHTDAYFNPSGLAYSTSSALGAEGVNFYRTRYEYDNTGQLKRVQTPQGTITRYVRNGFGEVVSEWVGTDDTPTTGYWSPTNTTGTNLVKVREYQYDNGAVGDGNLTKVSEYPGGGAAARVTQTWYDWRNRAVAVKSGVETTESTSVNRQLVFYTYDNLDRVTMAQVYDADGVAPTVTGGVPQPLSASLLRAQGATEFDELGRAFRTRVFSVNPATGAVSTNSLATDTWYDARGLTIKTSAPNGLVQKWAYDGAGRVTTAYTGDWGGDAGYADADDVVGDTVLTQVEYVYDPSGNVRQVTTRDRFHDASGTGALGTPTTGIAARVSYMGYYYDLADRTIAAVDVGTNGGSSWSRPGAVPSRSATVLVTSTKYATDAVQVIKLTGSPTGGTFTLTFGVNTTGAIAYNASAATVQTALAGLASIGAGNVQVSAAAGGGWEIRFIGTKAGAYQSAIAANGAGLTGGTAPAASVSTINAGGDVGLAAEVTDAAGRVTRTYADALGRTTRTVANFVDGVVSDVDDKATGYMYNGAGITSVIAYLSGGGVQTTGYVYGVSSATGSAVESNEIVRLTQWADPTSGAASATEQESVTVNALGQTVTTTDRNGNVHVLTYDVLGRVVSDSVTASGTNVGMIETGYDTLGNASLVTSRDATNAIVNQVAREYNGLGQLTAEWQSHSGAVTGSTPKVQYAYNFNGGGTTNQSRLTSITYPSGYVLTFNYSSGINSAVSRVSSLSDPNGAVESYDYLGLDTVVRRAHSGPSLDLSYIKRAGESNGDAGDQYTGLDRFGRIVDQRWLNPTTGTATDRFQYGYDQAGNRTYRDNLVSATLGEVYTYDALDQLTAYSRGTLNGTKTGVTGTASRTQNWDYDALGNFDSVTTNGTAQARTANKQNEITSISGVTTPTYDANGNMTKDETGKLYVYDAWNRLVTVKNSGGTVLKTYTYDGLNRRITETASGTTTDLFYSRDWQVLEEKVGSTTKTRYVWSPVYVNAMVLRDRDADGSTGNGLEERLWVQQDANFNVTALANSSGAVVERYLYDPYGNVTVTNASGTTLGSSAYAWAHTFQGMRLDTTSGFLEANQRWYSPILGRWVTLDPIRYAAGDMNLYRFVGNNSTNVTDPSGLDPLISVAPTGPDSPGGKFAHGVIDTIAEPFRIGGDLIRVGQWTVNTQLLGREMYEPDWHSNLAKKAPQANASPEEWDEYAKKSFKKHAKNSAIAVITFGAGKAAGPIIRKLRKPACVNCFPADTVVGTEHGLKPIQDVRAADRVWAFDLVVGEWKLRQVIETYRHEHDGDMVTATVAGEMIESTGHHPWWVARGEGLRGRPQPEHVPDNPDGYDRGGRWVDAIDLRVGDVLLLRSGEEAAITELVARHAKLPVYNFHVEELHCYAVGRAQILVHNNSVDVKSLNIAGSTDAVFHPEIVQGMRLQIRANSKKFWADALAKDGPIEIWEIGGKRYLFNGNHRYRAALAEDVAIPEANLKIIDKTGSKIPTFGLNEMVPAPGLK
ncbi:rhs repeat-associated core domain-containing protein : YD repeat protein OS=Isosphaera pallida (strain ATCC 43644 / DSM 9630 / IS1B) GN=Isop_2419 PE=4 SV=1: RHS_repeat: PT-HINT [Gemmata massiliana]|uniref:Hint domain-containing protein n=1 Tax=Gemmata massiliana TaxID=1210884 RepID=A0A6P2DGN3_9BACT|nr:RHS repeat-associated core domain-containing protein [Gemmata massiliana]VTR98885.1 rhs repeat-associated core domain-containing protein : YD repeat protein OS=Isosphaera pallida (strain ATCC 43644 / DSM 9630 / IS1B) GN=Isop_2419 PE=4 SV=1: RHS_repeat: PT-HINT [Gemmata massiliana]